MTVLRAILITSIACGLLCCAMAVADDSDNSSDNSASNSADNSADNSAANSASNSADNSADNAPAKTPASEPTATTKPDLSDRLTAFYIDEYGNLFRSVDWVARAMGIVSIARIDDPRVSKLLLGMARKDAQPLVRVFAWEALHARQDTLDKKTHDQWERIGLELGEKGYFHGDLRVGFLGLLGAEGPTLANRKMFSDLFQNTNSQNPDDIRTIVAMGNLLKLWQSQDLIQGLIGSMKKLEDAYRAELILHQVNPDIPLAVTLRDKGSAAMWAETQAKWSEWAKATTFTEMAASAGPAYKGLSLSMPRGEKIDPTDKKWKRDLEMKPFRLQQLDVGFAVDATGSMGQIVSWVQSDVIKMMRAFELLSHEPRIGVTFYRDRGDAFVTKTFPLTDNAKGLTAAMKDITAKGGGDIPEAVCEGLTALLNQRWSSGKKARRVILIIGDAPPHKESMPDIDKLVKLYAPKGFLFYAAKVRTAYSATTMLPNWDPMLSSFDEIAKKGGGRSFWVDFTQQAQNYNTLCDTAVPREGISPEQQMFREVLTATMEQDYYDRLDTFLTILMQYVDEPVKEARTAFGPKATGGPGISIPPPPPPKPEDMQKQ